MTDTPERPNVEALLQRADRDPYPPGDSRATYVGYGTVSDLCDYILALEQDLEKARFIEVHEGGEVHKVPVVDYLNAVIARVDAQGAEVEAKQGVIDAIDRVLKDLGWVHASRAIAIEQGAASMPSPDEMRDLRAVAALRAGVVAEWRGGWWRTWADADDHACDEDMHEAQDPADAILAALGKDESDDET